MLYVYCITEDKKMKKEYIDISNAGAFLYDDLKVFDWRAARV